MATVEPFWTTHKQPRVPPLAMQRTHSVAALPLTLGNEIPEIRARAAAARKENRFDEAEELLAPLAEKYPNFAPIWFDRGTTAYAAGQQEMALRCYLQAAGLDPTCAEFSLNVGALLEQLERQPEAFPWAKRAVEMMPNSALAHYNLGNVYRALADLPKSIEHLNRAIELDPENPKHHWNLAPCYLLQGDFAHGWETYEWRERAKAVDFDRYTEPLWDGSSLDGKILLVHAEQGIGDEILFASCYHELIERAKKLILVCEPRLVEIFKRSFPQASVYGHRRPVTFKPLAVPEPFDLQIPAGSVPQYLRTTLETFPQRERFLLPNHELVEAWRRRYEALGSGLKIGISWRAGGHPSERRRRTTTFETWAELFKLEGVQWINLQYGESDEEIAEAKEIHGVTIHDFSDADPLFDMDGFSAKVAALDLVISVGNATTHIAGAMGAPAWVLLPLVPAWRWMISGTRSPWYQSVRLYRQPTLGDWSDPFARVCQDLERLLTERGIAWRRRSSLARTTIAEGVCKRTDSENERFDSVKDQVALVTVVIPKALEEAVTKHRAGELAEAETLYRQILRRQPRHVDSLHLLGVVARQTGRPEVAVQSISRALALNDKHPKIHYNYASALLDLGRTAEAIAALRRATELDPNFGEAHLSLATALQNIGEASEALQCLEAAVAAIPRAADVHWSLGNAYYRASRLDEACESLERAIGLAPRDIRAYVSLAKVLLADGRADEALQFCQQAVALKPNHALAHHMHATVLRALQREEEAVASYRRALEIEPDRYDTLHHLGNLLQAQDLLDEAEECLGKAAGVRSDDPQAFNSLGQVLEEQGRHEEALANYERALARDPNQALARCNAALVRLRLGDYGRGWDDYEARWSIPDAGRPRTFFSQPAWNGTPLAGKTILVHGEQGLGDEILFASCLGDLRQRGAHCILACDYRLVGLFKRSFAEATVIGMNRGREHLLQVPPGLQVDFQIASGSLPRFLRRTLADFSQRTQFLVAATEQTARWRETFAALGSGIKIGISWRAGSRPKEQRLRSARLLDWSELFADRDACLINLQHGDCAEDIAQFEARSGQRVYCSQDFNLQQDIDALAAQISALDLVVSVGNTNAHLAGALGIPTWTIVPFNSNWCWGGTGDKTPWYQSLRVFRQESAGDWTGCLGKLCRELQQKTPGFRR